MLRVMAITDDIPDDNIQPPPLSPQAFSSHDTYNVSFCLAGYYVITSGT